MTAVTEKQRRTTEMLFHLPILKTIEELGGSASTSMIRERLQRKLRGLLRPIDHCCVKSGEVRWWNTACWARNQLKELGYLRSDSPYGVWEITEEGKQYRRELLQVYKQALAELEDVE